MGRWLLAPPSVWMHGWTDGWVGGGGWRRLEEVGGGWRRLEDVKRWIMTWGQRAKKQMYNNLTGDDELKRMKGRRRAFLPQTSWKKMLVSAVVSILCFSCIIIPSSPPPPSSSSSSSSISIFVIRSESGRWRTTTITNDGVNHIKTRSGWKWTPSAATQHASVRKMVPGPSDWVWWNSHHLSGYQVAWRIKSDNKPNYRSAPGWCVRSNFTVKFSFWISFCGWFNPRGGRGEEEEEGRRGSKTNAGNIRISP